MSMKLYTKSELDSTAYFEIGVGEFKHTHWKYDSIYIEDGDFSHELTMIFASSVRNFDYYGYGTINKLESESLISSLTINGFVELAAIIEELVEKGEGAIHYIGL